LFSSQYPVPHRNLSLFFEKYVFYFSFFVSSYIAIGFFWFFTHFVFLEKRTIETTLPYYSHYRYHRVGAPVFLSWVLLSLSFMINDSGMYPVMGVVMPMLMVSFVSSCIVSIIMAWKKYTKGEYRSMRYAILVPLLPISLMILGLFVAFVAENFSEIIHIISQ